jgi:hypothetical protein
MEKELEDSKIELARISFPHFMEYVIKDSHTGETIDLSDVHKSWCDHIKFCMGSQYDCGILSMWGYGKSSVVAVALPLFLIGQRVWDETKSDWNYLGRNLRIGLVCNADGNASKRTNSIGMYIKGSQEYHKVFPWVVPGKDRPWNDHRLEVERDVIAPEGTVEAYGIDSTGTGSRFDIMIYDDPVDQKDSDSETTRKSRIGKINNVWSSRIEPHGKSFWIATRWHKHDATHEQLQKDTWRFVVQAITDDFDRIVEPPPEYRHYISVVRKDQPRFLDHWKEKWPRHQVILRASRLGIRSFNRGLRQRPYSDDDTLFNAEHIEAACRWDMSTRDVPEEWPRFLGADLSSDQRPGTVVTVIARDPRTGKKALLAVKRGQWGWSAKTAHTIFEMFTTYKCRMGFVENNAAQATMLELIRSLHGVDVPLRGFTTGKQKADPLDGLPGLSIEFENDAWVFPLREYISEREYTASSEVPHVVLIRELLEYPHGANTDCVMSLWFANAASKHGQGLVVPGIFGGSGRGSSFQGRNNVFGSGYSGKKQFGGG